MSHTPGPWYEASTGNHQGLIAAEDNGANVAVAYDKRDAPLIAAAPDLLAAAEICVRTYPDMAYLFRAAIAKAREKKP